MGGRPTRAGRRTGRRAGVVDDHAAVTRPGPEGGPQLAVAPEASHEAVNQRQVHPADQVAVVGRQLPERAVPQPDDSVAASALVHVSYNSILFLIMIVATGGFRHLDKLTQ